jgi:hypothetical protein
LWRKAEIKIDLDIHRSKSKILRVRVSTTLIKFEGKALEEVESFAYLGSIV